jgi:hypothetical protein
MRTDTQRVLTIAAGLPTQAGRWGRSYRGGAAEVHAGGNEGWRARAVGPTT